MLARELYNFIIVFSIIYVIVTFLLNSAVVSEMTLPGFIVVFRF